MVMTKIIHVLILFPWDKPLLISTKQNEYFQTQAYDFGLWAISNFRTNDTKENYKLIFVRVHVMVVEIEKDSIVKRM